MYLYFTDKKYKDSLCECQMAEYNHDVDAAEAFMLLLNGLEYDNINILCNLVARELSIDDPFEIYEKIQDRQLHSNIKRLVLDKAYEIIHSNSYLGTKVDKNNNATSRWISHCLYVGEAAAVISEAMGLDADTAMKLGILHDIGRKFDQSFMHTIKGYEYLIDLDLKKEALATLTHSFLPIITDNFTRGNRCANCEKALSGFYIDENGNGVFESGSIRDDITDFLDNYEYNEYDMILNIADLMATSEGIISPYDRMLDVYTRKKEDFKNSPFFKVCFINTLNRVLYLITNDDQYNYVVNVGDMASVDKITELLVKISNTFMDEYNKGFLNKSY